ncbi:MAG: L-seryl-tRNA(Sec) selenium transferase [bacterium]|nr:L-seryl-tRNA(Sec) selenium transferase [bacterium]
MSPPTLLRRIPQVDRLLASAELQPLLRSNPRRRIVGELRETLDELRRLARDGSLTRRELEPGAIRDRLEERLARRAQPYYRRVINGTGVILHTGLGRAPLAAEVVAALDEHAAYSQRVEIELESGQRGGRDRGCDLLLRELIGCEAATVVNNNAAATLLILASLARGKRVLLSRGEMVEIGGSFRIPEIMRESGARLVDVGTTNRTHEKDYRSAIDAETGLILKVHTSNYRVVGFTSEVDVATLVGIGREHEVPVVHDLGSGCLIDLAAHGRPGEQLVKASVEAGADLVCFSGDKLLGGPQAGLIVGRREAVERCRRHPLYRTMRPGRLIYTALEATLRLYLEQEEEEILRKLPALRCLTADADELRRRARAMARRLADLAGFELAAVECMSQAGSGSLPAREFPSWGIRVVPVDGSVDELAAELRCGQPSILARAQDDSLLLDLRTLEEGELRAVEKRLRELDERQKV